MRFVSHAHASLASSVFSTSNDCTRDHAVVYLLGDGDFLATSIHESQSVFVEQAKHKYKYWNFPAKFSLSNGSQVSMFFNYKIFERIIFVWLLIHSIKKLHQVTHSRHRANAGAKIFLFGLDCRRPCDWRDTSHFIGILCIGLDSFFYWTSFVSCTRCTHVNWNILWIVDLWNMQSKKITK